MIHRLARKTRNLPVQGKISSIYILTNVILLIVNSVLLIGMNVMSSEMEMVYRENLHLNELTEALASVQDSMTTYLNVKTSDALEDYYISAQEYSELIGEMNEQITSSSADRMKRSIKNLSTNYLDTVGQTIEAKRGRNVEKYRFRYEKATQLYEYINTYIYSLNDGLFKSNSENFVKLSIGFKRFETVGIIIMLSVIVGNISIIIKLTGTIIAPLKILASKADEVAKGNLNIELIGQTSEDEIGVVTNAFNQMVVSIREYIERTRQNMEMERARKEKELRMEAHLKDAQLKYLQAQINPHFLFNTLNAGAQLAMMESADRTYEYVQRVAEFFRYNVKKGDDDATIQDELSLVDNYIYILNIRFSGEIGYEKQIDERLLSVKMPSMILQPVVENCVNHGIREMMGEGKIWLSVYQRDEEICISIRDNGIGMNREAIENVMKGDHTRISRQQDSNGIGMDNVMARLKLYCGKDRVMSIISEGEGKGTEFIIYLGMENQEADDV